MNCHKEDQSRGRYKTKYAITFKLIEYSKKQQTIYTFIKSNNYIKVKVIEKSPDSAVGRDLITEELYWSTRNFYSEHNKDNLYCSTIKRSDKKNYHLFRNI
ncbi:unnamed protein product [Gordionus sp. m RMFG-2023]